MELRTALALLPRHGTVSADVERYLVRTAIEVGYPNLFILYSIAWRSGHVVNGIESPL